MVEVLMADEEFCRDYPECERLLEAAYMEMATGYRSRIVVLPFPKWERIRQQLNAPLIADCFYVHTCQGTIKILPELPC